jgi:hypothetical protein
VKAADFTPKHTHRTPDVALWDPYRALRERWMHEAPGSASA